MSAAAATKSSAATPTKIAESSPPSVHSKIAIPSSSTSSTAKDGGVGCQMTGPTTVDAKFRVTERKWLTAAHLKEFEETGCLFIRADQIWTPEEKKALIDGSNLMDNWPEAAGKWMKYFEKSSKKTEPSKKCDSEKSGTDCMQPERLIQRIENFCQYNPLLNSILNGQKLLGMLSELFGELAVLYKEKINYKMPGGSGFAPHQDVLAGWWMYGQTLHISTLITVDQATQANGALEVVLGQHRSGRLAPDWKEIPDETVKKLDWKLMPTQPGDVLFFDSYVPHRSAPNHTDRPRRVLYATYAKLSEGDWREKYYADKRKSFPPDVEREPGKVYEYKI